jgi:polyhydroxyalkanoate synthesis regulator phasin
VSFFRKSAPQVEIPVGTEREDLLADLARRAGERKQQVQNLLEEFARREDERRTAPPEQPSFQRVLKEVEPAAAATPLISMERRWSTKAEPSADATPADITRLEERIASLENEQRKLVGIVEGLISVLHSSRKEMARAAER